MQLDILDEGGNICRFSIMWQFAWAASCSNTHIDISKTFCLNFIFIFNPSRYITKRSPSSGNNTPKLIYIICKRQDDICEKLIIKHFKLAEVEKSIKKQFKLLSLNKYKRT